MNGSIAIIVEILWVSCGLGSIAVATVANTEDFWVKIVTFLCGVLTLLMSVLFASYIKHISSHAKERESLVKDKDCDDRRQIMCQKLDWIMKAMKIKFEISDEELE